MSLIKCPECNKEVSSAAIACPHCGFHVAIHTQHTNNQLLKVQRLAQLREVVSKNLNKNNKPSYLRTVNGVGCKMFGFHPIFTHEGKYVGLSFYAFCFLFIPILPLGIYLTERDGDSYLFYGSVPMLEVLHALGFTGGLRFIGSILIEMIIFVLVLIAIIAIAVYFRSCSQ